MKINIPQVSLFVATWCLLTAFFATNLSLITRQLVGYLGLLTMALLFWFAITDHGEN